MIPNQPNQQRVLVGFCSDIVGQEEPVFTKPFLTALRVLEEQGKIELQVQPCQFASEYSAALGKLARSNRVVFCGPMFSRVIVRAAQDYPDTLFVLMLAIPDPLPADALSLPNLQWLLYRKDDTAFLMGQISSFFPKKAFCWLVTDLPDHHPIRIYEETAFIKGLQPSTHSQGILEWPAAKTSSMDTSLTTPDQPVAIYCVTEGAYVPAFLEWITRLPGQQRYIVLPDGAWTSEQNLIVLGNILKNYTLPLEYILDQVISDSWQTGVHYISHRNHGFLVRLNAQYWESSLKKEIESKLNVSADPES